MADLTWWQEVIKSNDWPGTDERLAVVVACVPVHRVCCMCLCSLLCKVDVLMVNEFTSVKQLQATDARHDWLDAEKLHDDEIQFVLSLSEVRAGRSRSPKQCRVQLKE